MNRDELRRKLEESIRQINDVEIDAIVEGVKSIHGVLLAIIQSEKSNQESGKESVVADTLTSDIFETTKKVGTIGNAKFDDFIGLQEDPRYNISSQLLKLLIRIENFEFPDDEDEKKVQGVVIQILQILQGVLLIHPKSRNVFKGKFNIGVMMKLLDPKSSMKPNFLMIIECVLMLVSLFIRNCENLRNFEELGGIALICGLIKGEYEEEEEEEEEGGNVVKSQLTWQNVRIKSLEFLFFYLIPEFSGEGERVVGVDRVVRRSMESKIGVLKEYLNEEFVDGIVAEFVGDRPFGESGSMW